LYLIALKAWVLDVVFAFDLQPVAMFVAVEWQFTIANDSADARSRPFQFPAFAQASPGTFAAKPGARQRPLRGPVRRPQTPEGRQEDVRRQKLH
jgi:hypothetical protein